MTFAGRGNTPKRGKLQRVHVHRQQGFFFLIHPEISGVWTLNNFDVPRVRSKKEKRGCNRLLKGEFFFFFAAPSKQTHASARPEILSPRPPREATFSRRETSKSCFIMRVCVCGQYSLVTGRDEN